VETISEVFNDPRGHPFHNEEARGFSEPFGADLASWWNAAPRANWMVLVGGACEISETRLIQAVCQCTRIAFRFVPSVTRKLLEPFLSVGERGACGEARAKECREASDKVSEIQSEIMEAFNAGDANITLAAMRATGAVATAIGSAAYRRRRGDCVLIMHSAISQVQAAGNSPGGASARTNWHLQCVKAMRNGIRADELAFPPKHRRKRNTMRGWHYGPVQ
jgi:hypothetical protein